MRNRPTIRMEAQQQQQAEVTEVQPEEQGAVDRIADAFARMIVQGEAPRQGTSYRYNVGARAYEPLTQPRDESDWHRLCQDAFEKYEALELPASLVTHEARYRWLVKQQDRLLRTSWCHVVHCSPLLWHADEVQALVLWAEPLGCGGHRAYVAYHHSADNACRLGCYDLAEPRPNASSLSVMDPRGVAMNQEVRLEVERLLKERGQEDRSMQSCRPVIRPVANSPLIRQTSEARYAERKPVVNCASVSPDGRLVAYHAGLERVVHLLAIEADAVVDHRRLPLGGGDAVPTSIAVSAAGCVAVAFNRHLYADRTRKMPPHVRFFPPGQTRACHWQPEGEAAPGDTELEDVPHVNCVCFAEAREVAYVGTQTGELYEIDLAGGRPVQLAKRLTYEPGDHRLEALRDTERVPDPIAWTQGREASTFAAVDDTCSLVTTTDSFHVQLGATAEEQTRRVGCGKEPLRIQRRVGVCTSIAGSGMLMAVQRQDGTVMVGDLGTGRPCLHYPEQPDGSLSVSPFPYRALRIYPDRICALMGDGSLVFFLPDDDEFHLAKEKYAEETRRKKKEEAEAARQQQQTPPPQEAPPVSAHSV